ncbi:PqqD family protein [endosymbiont of unidentified scaly snail isolate Monju]|uniref:PqqD family protein n=1 Tax=endosymbiont of unidentified scaly snail isolate Monju TaxID=1248727 RepID=UPI0003892180|nr:PqqD family protein [endosymbiont of unidentified scaly snail isolate Monju]BAN68246.1 hypothetical protein EBS_0263 [endosymbiont of unidentified scaly snail isolate Monju]
MSGQLFSPVWYRVADLRPRLRRHVALSRHRYRGQRWYLLSDPVSGRDFRINEAGWALVGRFDGRRTLQRLWQEVCERLGDAAPTQDEVIRLLGRLHQADLVQMPPPATARTAAAQGAAATRPLAPVPAFPAVDQDPPVGPRRLPLAHPAAGRPPVQPPGLARLGVAGRQRSGARR